MNRTRSLDSDSVRVCPTGNGIRAILDGPGPVTVPSPPRLRRRNLKHRGGSGSCQQKDNQVTSPARTGAGRPGPGPARPPARPPGTDGSVTGASDRIGLSLSRFLSLGLYLSFSLSSDRQQPIWLTGARAETAP